MRRRWVPAGDQTSTIGDGVDNLNRANMFVRVTQVRSAAPHRS